MIKFFRKTRQKLLAEKKIGRYLAYAIGEIVLVVIGILIALAINNKNQRNIDYQNEKTYLLGLKEEFNTNKYKLTELIAVNKANMEATREILELINLRDSMPPEMEFSRLLYNSMVSDIAFDANNSFLNEIINSGSLKKISNPKLRIMLTNWVATLEDVTRQEKDLGLHRESVLNMFRTNEYSLKTVFQLSGINSKLGLSDVESGFKSNLDLLSSIEFENKMLLFLSTSQATEEAHYAPLMKFIDNILNTITAEL